MKVPRFQVDRTLGSGSTGEVLHGRLLEECGGLPAGSEVAVKYLHASLTSEARATRAFEREAETALSVRDEGLVRAIAAGKDERGPFIVMEYVPGRTLREILVERGPLPEPILRSVATQLAGGLAALHEAGYVHGDVKPENVRLDQHGRAVLVDLGFARRPGKRKRKTAARRAEAPEFGSGSRAAGTLLYLAPEKLRGEPGRAASDVYALGLVLYELATGTHPFAALPGGPVEGTRSSSRASVPAPPSTSSEANAVVERMLRGDVPPASTRDPMLSPFLDSILAACLEPDREDRPDARQLHDVFAVGEASPWWRETVDFEAAARAAGRDRIHFTPLVGRAKDLAALQGLANSCFDAERSRGARLVWLEGELGTGKTRFARELVSRLRSRRIPPLFLYGRSWATRENLPCQPLLRMLQRYLGLPRNGVPSERDREHLAGLVTPREVQTLLSTLDPHGDEATPVSVPAALAAWLLALAEKHPVLILLDDVHHADAETLRALTLVVEGLREQRLFALLGVGTDEEPRHARGLAALRERIEAGGRLTSLRLSALREEDVQALVSRLFDHESPILRLGETLWRRSQGHPGLLAELLRGMVSRGDMRRSSAESGRFSLDVLPSSLPHPETFQRAIRDSFRALPQGDRLWLQRLSVVGRKIEPEFVLRAFEHTSRRELDEVLASLVASSWLVPHGRRFRFARPASREVVYQTLSPARRERLHAAAARALKPAAGTPITITDAFQRAFHLRAAAQFRELLVLIRPLLKRFAARGMPQRVWRLATWGLEALEASGTDRGYQLELLERAADAADSLGRREDQRALLDRLASREEAGASGEPDPVVLGRVYLLHGRYAANTGRNGLARGWFLNAAQLFESADASELRAESLRRLALVQAAVGELSDAEKRAREALAEAPPGSAGREQARLALATVLLLNDRLEAALGDTARAMTRLRTLQDASVGGALTQGHILRARVYRCLGRPLRALAAASRALQLARGCGERRLEVEAGARLGGLLLGADRVEEAEARLRDARLLAGEVEDKSGQALASLFLGVLLAEDDRAETRARLEESTRLAVQAALPRVEALSLAIEARLDRIDGRLERARECADRAMQLTDRYGAELFDRIVIEGTVALVARERGDSERSLALERGLSRRLKRESARISASVHRRRHRVASTRLLEAALSSDGPLYPRVRRTTGD